MIIFPIAKINLGLNVVERRTDGYHNLETVFYPVPISDALEVHQMDVKYPSAVDCDIKIDNIPVDGDEQCNLVVRAYRLLKQDFPTLPRIHAHLFKNIPTQAGMGGGSSDGAAMILLLNEMFKLCLTEEQMIAYSSKLGADCPFFILNRPSYAEGIGEKLMPIDLCLDKWYIAVVKPNISVSTKEAFSLIKPRHPQRNCRDVVGQPVETWRDSLFNDFEESVFAIHPQIGMLKDDLYDLGAVYAAMSGSGSAVYGLFRDRIDLAGKFQGMYKAVLQL